jgi:uncharacterized protein YaiE (UPF0345 family)
MAITTVMNTVNLTTTANIYFDGKCVSHSFTMSDGTKKSVGVILPSTLTFNTQAAETMECVSGRCEYQLNNSTVWISSKAGECFNVPAQATFDIRVAEGMSYHYICHFA